MLGVEGAWMSLEECEKLGKVWRMYTLVEEKLGKNIFCCVEILF